MHDALDLADLGAAELWAVLDVETSGRGFLASRRPQILFERHVFSAETKGRWDATNPEVSAPSPGGYGATGEHQYDRLAQAIELDRSAALRSASWGLGQVMGFNADRAGYAGVEEMVAAMLESEGRQLAAAVRFLTAMHLDRPLRQRDWPTFARGYNGAGYAANRYDARLAASYQRFASGGLPDLRIRAAQLWLSYLGLEPGKVDGFLGRLTRSAMNAFQQSQGMAASEGLDDATFDALRQAVAP